MQSRVRAFVIDASRTIHQPVYLLGPNQRRERTEPSSSYEKIVLLELVGADIDAISGGTCLPVGGVHVLVNRRQIEAVTHAR
jgi:hypothetical protein